MVLYAGGESVLRIVGLTHETELARPMQKHVTALQQTEAKVRHCLGGYA